VQAAVKTTTAAGAQAIHRVQDALFTITLLLQQVQAYG
jgi:hypothetical protein